MRISDWSSDLCSSDLLCDRDQAGDAAAALIFAAHRVAGALGCDHEHVDVAAGLDQAEMDVEAVGKGDRGAGLHVGAEVVGIDFRLMLIGGGDHDDRSEEHTSELQSLMRHSYAVFCLKK